MIGDDNQCSYHRYLLLFTPTQYVIKQQTLASETEVSSKYMQCIPSRIPLLKKQ